MRRTAHHGSTMSLTISIRQAQREHLRDMLAINTESAPGVSLLTSGDLNHIVQTASVTWVALVNEQVAGYTIAFTPSAAYEGEEFGWFQSRVRDFLYVDQIAVSASQRSRGIGAVLYEKLEQFAERNQLWSLVCEVNMNPPNPGSMAFHQRRGFTEIERLGTADGRHVALLHKRLQAAPGEITNADQTFESGDAALRRAI